MAVAGLESRLTPSGCRHPRRAVQIRVLRGFEVIVGGRVLTLPRGVQRLLAFLALRRGALRRPYVSVTLWPEAREERAGANLRSVLWRLQGAGPRLVEATSTHVGLAAQVRVDLQQAVALAQGLVDTPRRLPSGSEAERLLGLDLLPDWFDEWVLMERERFRQLRLHSLESLCSALTGLGQFQRAVDVGMLAIAGDPLRESAHRMLICAHLAEGNRGEALLQFDRCRRLLKAELGVEPSPEIVNLIGFVVGADFRIGLEGRCSIGCPSGFAA